ncbi:MAG TPA: S41 family peptidase [Bellilinea sp.]|nr:S41 family peptidase [Bellilinea sp.]
MNKPKEIWPVIAAVLLTVLVISIAFMAGYLTNNGYTQFSYDIYDQAYKILEQNGIKDMPSDQQTEYALIRGLIQAYDDPYTVFVEPPQHELETNQLEGKFGGIGAALQRDTQGVLRVYPYTNSPASEAGVPDGSQLLSVDDLTVTTDTPDDAVISALRGKVGSRVTISVLPQGVTDPAEFSIERREFGIPSVSWQIVPEQPELGIVKIISMTATTADEVDAAIQEITAKGVSVVILDLRDNGGGLVEAGVDVVKLFAHAGSNIIEQHYPNQSDMISKGLTDGKYVDLPLLIFANRNTASSAEIVVGALQALDRVTVIGEQTFGKDTIQLVFDLTDGSSIHVSAAQWELPENPAFTSGAGLLPNIPLTLEAPTDADYIRVALEIYENNNK